MHYIAQGKLDYMAVIFERYHVRMYNFFLQMTRDRAVSEDLTQNVFYKVLRYRKSYQGGKVVSWIFKIGRNLLTDHYRLQKKAWNTIPENWEGQEEQAASEVQEDVAHLYAALNKLNIQDRELIVMNRLQGMKYESIAEIIGSSESAVKVRVHRIIKKLRIFYFETI